MSRSASSTSSWSLRLHGPVVVNPLEGSQCSKLHKKVAHWTDAETTVLLNFLKEQPQGDGASYKKNTWTAVKSHMAVKFVTIKGGVKTADTCERQYLLVGLHLLVLMSSNFDTNDWDRCGTSILLSLI